PNTRARKRAAKNHATARPIFAEQSGLRFAVLAELVIIPLQKRRLPMARQDDSTHVVPCRFTTRPRPVLCRTRRTSCRPAPNVAAEEPAPKVLRAADGIRRCADRPLAIPPCRRATSGRRGRREIHSR